MKCLFCDFEIENISRDAPNFTCPECQSFYMRENETDKYIEFMGYPYKRLKIKYANIPVRIPIEQFT